MQKRKTGLAGALGLGVLSLALAGCGGGSSSRDPAQEQPPEETATANVRVIHAVADAPDVNASLNDGDQVQGLAFTEITDLLEVEAASYSVTVDALLPSDKTVDGVISVDSLELAENTETNIVATGSAAVFAGGDPSAVAPVVVVPSDDPIDSGRARFSVVHAAEGVGEVDIYATTTDNNSLGLTPFLRLDEGEQASADLFSDPGRRVRITLAGEDPTDENNIVFDSGDQIPALPAGENYLLVAINNTGAENSPVRLLAVTGDTANDVAIFSDKDAEPAARAAHFSEDAGQVDIEVGGQAVFTGLNFTETSEFLRVPETLRNQDGTATVDVGPGAVSKDVPLANGDFHTGYAVGLAAVATGDTALDLIASTGPIRSIATEAQVRVVHAASQVPGNNGLVDVYLGSGASAEPIDAPQDVAYKDVSDYISLPVDLANGTEYTLQVLPDGVVPDGTNAAITVTTRFNPGDVLTVVARDDDTGVPSFEATVIDDAQAVTNLRNPR